MLDDPRTVRVTGDGIAAVFRRVDDADAERRPEDYRGRPVPEAYVWCNLTSGNGSRALWLLLLPFMVVNLAHWMRPTTRDRQRTVRLYGLLVRLAGLTLTVLLVAAACEVALDLTAWQCAGTRACAEEHSWLGFLSPDVSGGGWWSAPGRRLALASLVPAALTGLLWYLSHRTWRTYESQQPARDVAGRAEESENIALDRPGFWYGRRLVARLRAAHTAAGFLTVAAAVGTSAARYDRGPGGPVPLEVLGWLLNATLAAGAVVVVWVVCRRGRGERRLDRELDRALVRRLPVASVAVWLLAVLYAGWPRPEWTSGGRLPGDMTFGGITLVQSLLVVVLGVVAQVLYRSRPDPRAAMRGLAGPAVAMLACALGGVMSGGVAQRVADWLNGTGDTAVLGPPVLLTWQASVIPPLLVVVAVLVAWLAWRTTVLHRRELVVVEREYGLEKHGRRGGVSADGTGTGTYDRRGAGPGTGKKGSVRPDDDEAERRDTARTRRIARTRAMAALTDRAPRIVGIVSAVTLLLGIGSLLGATLTGEVPGEAARGTSPFVEGAAQTAQALGSWLIGFGFILFVTWGRRAYKDASARRTIGILWDVGTFWPRAAHPFAPPCYAERAVPDLTWRMETWTRATGGRLVISGHSQGSVLAAAAAWQLSPSVRERVALLTYGSPLERLYGRWFPAHFGPHALDALHREIDCWRNLHRRTDPIGGPVRVHAAEGADGADGPEVDAEPFRDPLAYGRTRAHPLPTPILGHSDYQADPAFARERKRLLDRIGPEVPGQRAAGR
ncbi:MULTISPECIES: hypothetical protein [Streptomyces]|nr:hypothetical protein [Streptomyces ruber]